MKNTFIAIFIFIELTTNAQNYLIAFTGTGSSSVVSSVKVENLTTGASLSLSGSDILQLTMTTGVNQDVQQQFSELLIYPNPGTDIVTIEFCPPSAGDATTIIYDYTGRLLAQNQTYYTGSPQALKISGIGSGIYLVNIRGKSYRYSAKIAGNGTAEGNISIERTDAQFISVEKESVPDNKKGINATIEMQYASGNRIKFTGVSGDYSTVITDIPSGDKTITFNFSGCVDGDNNSYPIVKIGNQTWMAENLKTTKYSNGVSIPFVNDAGAWDILTSADKAFCYFFDNINNSNILGALYTWGAAMNGAGSSSENPSGVQGVCPTGWHLPSDAEWTVLTTYLGGVSEAGRKLKETGTLHWSSPNSNATNESGFTALPGGFRDDWAFFGDRILGNWWSSTERNSANSWFRRVDGSESTVYVQDNIKKFGISVRCVKD